MSSKKSRRLVMAGTAALALGLSSCGGGDTGTNDGAGGDVDCAAFSDYGDLEGSTVTVYTAIVSPEADPYVESFRAFEECTGATVQYEGDKAFAEQISVRVQGGNAPDIAFVPQPGLLQTLVETGEVVAAPDETIANIDEFFGDDWKAYGTVDDTVYGTPLGASVKSLVWYSPSAFSDNGYEVPETWEDMLSLSQQIAGDNDDGLTKPWCVGFGDGAATGWVGTDWIEDVMLRTSDGDTYDQWVTHEIPFDDPAVVEAFDAAGEILKNDDFVNGGLGDSRTISTTAFVDAGLPILDGTCFMHRQASFYAGSWPEGTEVGPDGDVWAFYLPAVNPDEAKPIIGGGDLAIAFDERPEVQAFMTYLSSDDWANERARATTTGGAVSANSGLDPELLVSEVDQLSVEMLQDENAVFRFDGSDLMPSAVGAGSFWSAMVEWTTDGKSSEEVTSMVEQNWPSS